LPLCARRGTAAELEKNVDAGIDHGLGQDQHQMTPASGTRLAITSAAVAPKTFRVGGIKVSVWGMASGPFETD
jgi:hypothetical protein